MGYTVFEFNFPTNYQESDLRNRIQKSSGEFLNLRIRLRNRALTPAIKVTSTGRFALVSFRPHSLPHCPRTFRS